MTSATQSNSGASEYLGLASILSGQPGRLPLEFSDGVKADLHVFLQGVQRTSGSSGWLKDLYLMSPDSFDGMINYEAVVIETNVDLQHRGDAPLHVVYFDEGVVMADSPLGYVDNQNPARLQDFLKLQTYLLKPETQSRLLKLGPATAQPGGQHRRLPARDVSPGMGH